jgi:hypothetical protein
VHCAVGVTDRRRTFLGFRAISTANIVNMTAYGMTYSVLRFENQVNMTGVTFRVSNACGLMLPDLTAALLDHAVARHSSSVMCVTGTTHLLLCRWPMIPVTH